MQSVIDYFQQSLTNLGTGGQLLLTALISMIPVIELRGALPLAAAAGLPWYFALPAAVVGNMIPIPLILLFIKRIFQFLRDHTKLGKLVDRLETKANKAIPKIQKYEWWGLCVFVAIPLPGTGGWSGALAGAVMGLKLKRAVPCIFLGVLIAGIIVTIVSYGLIH
jgi:uncharacterized membrane protein